MHVSWCERRWCPDIYKATLVRKTLVISKRTPYGQESILRAPPCFQNQIAEIAGCSSNVWKLMETSPLIDVFPLNECDVSSYVEEPGNKITGMGLQNIEITGAVSFGLVSSSYPVLSCHLQRRFKVPLSYKFVSHRNMSSTNHNQRSCSQI